MMEIQKMVEELEKLHQQTRMLEKLHYKIVEFATRSKRTEYKVEKSTSEYEFINITPLVPNILFERNSQDLLLDSSPKVVLHHFKAQLEISRISKYMAVGQNGASGYEALWGAWQILTSLRDNVYIIFCRTNKYSDFYAFVFQGDIEKFFTAEEIGRHSRSDTESELDIWEKILPKVPNTRIENFTQMFYWCLRFDILR